jgi:hypothetical protein
VRRLIGTVTILSALVAASLAFGQAYTPPSGVKMGINLYPVTKYRGAPEVLTKSMPKLNRPIEAQSWSVSRGIWELCGNYNYEGPCQRVSESREGIPVSVIVRSARLVGDTGFDSPVPVLRSQQLEAAAAAAPPPRAAPAPVVAPAVTAGGVAGANQSLRGTGVEFFAAPARDGLRILACAEGAPSARCIQATADSFCAERGYLDSSNRDTENVGGRAYLANTLCKSSPDAGSRSAKPTPEKKKGLLGRIGL